MDKTKQLNAVAIQTITENANATVDKGHGFVFDNLDGLQQLRILITAGTSGIPVIDSRSPIGIITDTDWHHVAVTGDGTNVIFYVDGIAYPGTGTMGAKSSGDSTNLLRIGDDTAASPMVVEAFGGLIDEVEIFSRALSVSEIQAIFNADSAGKCKPANIVAAGATIVTEGCSPANGAIDPGETVTVDFCVQNTGDTATSNLVGTLQATGGVTNPSGPQNYGAVMGGAVVNYPPPSSSGSCGDITCSPSSGSFFPVGTTTVMCDAAGTMANPDCTFTVTVNDTQPPSITCPQNVTSVTNQTCPPQSGVVTTFPPPTASDNCPGVTVMCSPASGSTFPVGTTTVTCTATDASGNTATCTFSVTAFNACLQDDARPNNVVLFNTFTGDYRFCCGATVIFTGRGKVSQQGCIFTLQHNAPDRSVFAKIDFSARRGNASLQRSAGPGCTIGDTNIRDNTCQCGVPAMVSDRNLKANFEAVNTKDVLERLVQIPIQVWSYKDEPPSVRHIGPMAQDFAAAFKVGNDDRQIQIVDANGVTMAAIQALHHLNAEKDGKIERLEKQNAELRSRLEAVEKAVKKLAKD